MRWLYNWFWEWMDEQENRYGQRAVAGLLGMLVLWMGLLIIGLLVWLSSKIQWLKNL